ncbi:amino acid ABC transporter permease [Methylobacterium nodulans]|uniref:Polar amino acid ABC transporter, inner membrane subunit n=1 Tax=Methylobacterium nodulans (strain LMG 21967 / CNCM I-2342 / ORS 2060) TaxID=460265 RepID=B8IXQ3_METNO|nr:amino acid ABC transporter permease [Methylobacterium nodulans]ACL62885.1 polar amino acid ABC transporter, inner membrane subunit [Methylobacterium nodulans ORS 2060]
MSQTTTAKISEAAGDPVPSIAGIPAAPITRAPPLAAGAGPLGWARTNLFSSIPSTIVTLVLLILLARWATEFVNWAILHAVWSVPNTATGPDTAACRDAKGIGACWAVISEKYRFILFGRYLYEEQWRPAIVIVLFIGLYVVSAMRQFWRKELILIWITTLTVVGVLMWGGVFGLTYVPQDSWGGLPITLILATFGLACAFPLSILVALGRRATNLPAIRVLCTVYVELIRGVPLITVLFMASVMFPLFMPAGLNPDKLLRAQVAVILFAAAYLAEVVRGGLQTLPKGQYEAADALGLGYWHKTAFIILPQALRLVIPPLVNTFIGFFKDTSLVLIIGLFDLLTAGKVAMADLVWQPYSTEVYLVLAAIYFAFCYVMARYSRGLEQGFSRSTKR